MGFHPVVYFGPRSGDGPNAFHDPRVGDNSWDYFFEPVAGLSWAELRARLADPRDPLTPADVVQLDADFLWHLHAYDPDGVYNYPYGHYKSLTDDGLDAWYARQRASARRLLSRYVRPKPHILAKVDAFWQAELAGHDVLGVHMRGSDKGAADASTRLSASSNPRNTSRTSIGSSARRRTRGSSWPPSRPSSWRAPARATASAWRRAR